MKTEVDSRKSEAKPLSLAWLPSSAFRLPSWFYFIDEA